MVVWLFLTTFDLFASKHANSHSLFKTHEPPPSNTMLSFTTHIFTLYVRSDLWIGLLCAQMFYKCFGACCSVSPSRISSFDSLEFWVLSHRKKRVMVISSIGMWPFAPAVIKTFSPLIFWFLVSSMNIVHLGEIFIGDVNCWNYKQQGLVQLVSSVTMWGGLNTS